MLNYFTIKPLDSANGIGIGTSIFFTGCRFHCQGCFNSIAWNENAGDPVTDEVIDKFIEYLKNPHVSHSAILGGEPLLLLDPETLEHFLKRVKTEVPEKPMWLWTGYELEDIKNSKDYLDSIRLRLLITYVDYLVDGKFVESLASKRIIFRGSSNQIIYKKNESGIFEPDEELNNFRL